jgi:hypothetical protein
MGCAQNTTKKSFCTPKNAFQKGINYLIILPFHNAQEHLQNIGIRDRLSAVATSPGLAP